MNTMMYLGQLLGGVQQVWLQVALLVSVFAVLTWRPERIRNASLFHVACLLFALALIAPGILPFFMEDTPAPMLGARNAQAQPLGNVTKGILAAPPILLGLSFLFLVTSVLPTGTPEKSAPLP
jgi:hypothetical protein